MSSIIKIKMAFLRIFWSWLRLCEGIYWKVSRKNSFKLLWRIQWQLVEGSLGDSPKLISMIITLRMIGRKKKTKQQSKMWMIRCTDSSKYRWERSTTLQTCYFPFCFPSWQLKSNQLMRNRFIDWRISSSLTWSWLVIG